MSRVFWDTNIFIYLIEDKDTLGIRAAALASRMHERGDQLFSSTLSLGEVLVRPSIESNEPLRAAYEDLFARHVTLVPFDQEAARLYATIRRDRSLRAPDAIQLACAGCVGTDVLVTNDRLLPSKRIPGIQFITTLDGPFI